MLDLFARQLSGVFSGEALKNIYYTLLTIIIIMSDVTMPYKFKNTG